MASVFLNNFKGLDYLTPEILLSISAILLLLFELFSKDRALLLKTIIALAVLVFGLALVIVQPLQSSFTLFNGLVVVDGFANFFRFLFIIATGLTVLVAFKSTEIDPKDYGETIVFLLITVVFMSLLVMATNFLLIYLSLESLSLVSYILVANRRKSSKASEAGLKYAIKKTHAVEHYA